jgi:hypothetical protein
MNRIEIILGKALGLHDKDANDLCIHRSSMSQWSMVENA